MPDARIDAVVAEAVRKIDAVLERRRDEVVIAMVEAGVEPDDIEDALAYQLELEAQWRAQALPTLLAEIAAWLCDPQNQGRDHPQ